MHILLYIFTSFIFHLPYSFSHHITLVIGSPEFVFICWFPCSVRIFVEYKGSVVGPRPVDGRGVFCTLACWVCGVGWGGDGMLTFDELAHMVDATQLVRGGWGGG